MVEDSAALEGRWRGLVVVEPVDVPEEAAPVEVDVLVGEVVDNDGLIRHRLALLGRRLPEEATEDGAHIIHYRIDPHLPFWENRD